MSIRHDYKSAAIGQRRQRARRYGLLVMTLVLIGLFGGLLAYIKGAPTQPAPATAVVAPSAPAQPPAPVAPPKTVVATPVAPPKTVVATPAEPEPVKPKYDFYTELPKRHIAIQHETVRPRSASQPAPARLQPAAHSPHKPATPRGNAKNPTPTTTAASRANPDSRTTNSRTTDSRTTNSKTAHSESANSKTPNSKTVNAKTANSESANSKTANSKTANSTSTSSRPVTAKTANSEPANSKSASTNSKSTPTTSKPATAKPATAKPGTVAPIPATTPTRTVQPVRSLPSNSSKMVVKTE